MRTGAAAGHAGYFHEAVLHSSDTELLDVVVPFLRGGVAAGEPTVVALGERHARLVETALGPVARDVIFQPVGDTYGRPASAIRAYRTLLAAHTAAGAAQIRIIGELPAEALEATWDWWARYESAINHAYDDFPLWSMCAYDTRTTPGPVLADILRTHPRVARPGDRHEPSPDYAEPREFLREDRPVVPDPLELTPPAVELTGPAPTDARAALATMNRAGVLGEDALADMQIAVTETVTNALRHGTPPVLVRGWVGPDRLVVTVTDRGPGPDDPFAGLQAAAHAPIGGLGLWLTHQLCDHVALARGPEGFMIRMIAGASHHRVPTRPAAEPGLEDHLAG
jgi:anti-sigma regulatory factor (Ser/Thr protein kinase)